MIYKLVYPWGPQFRSPPWHKSPWVCVYSGLSPHRYIKTSTYSHTHTQNTSVPVLLTWQNSWYFIKIKYSEQNISAAASVSPLAFAVLLLAVIKQRCIAAGVPFWIGGELPVFVVRHHAPNRDACTVTVRYEYMYRATPISQTFPIEANFGSLKKSVDKQASGAPNTWKLRAFLLNFSPISSRLEMYYPVFCSNNES